MYPQVIELRKAPLNSKKKWVAIAELSNGKRRTIKFGANGYSDYTIHHDRARRERYRLRHAADLKAKNADSMLSPGYLSMYILWGSSTNIDKNLASFNKMLMHA